jgi:hypothetical protein
VFLLILVGLASLGTAGGLGFHRTKKGSAATPLSPVPEDLVVSVSRVAEQVRACPGLLIQCWDCGGYPLGRDRDR